MRVWRRELGEGSGGHGPAPADDRHPIGQCFDLAEDVTRQQDRAAVDAPLADDLLEGLFHERVQPGSGLVEHKQVGVGGKGGDEGDLLPVALGVVADPFGRVEVESLDEGGPASLVEPAMGCAEDVEALPTGEPRPERDIAGDIGEPFVERCSLAPRVTPEELDVPTAGADEAEDDADRRRLARPVGTEEAVHLAGGHLEVEPVEGANRSEGLGQPLGPDDGLGRAHRGCYSFRGALNAPSA